MQAVRYDRYGPPEVLQWTRVPTPVPRRGEVLVRVAAAALNPKDCLVRKGKFRLFTGRRLPRGCGYDVAGHVEACGPGHGPFKAGDAVFGMRNGWAGDCLAEYVCLPVDELAPAPARVPLEECAGIPLAALTSLQALRDLGHLRAQDSVLINGASGGVGCFAVQIAKHLDAQVTAVCSAANHPLATSLGADEVVDYQRTDIRQLDQRFDVVFDVFGSLPYPAARPLLKPRARHITTIPNLANLRVHVLTRLRPGPQARLVVVKSRAADLHLLRDWADAGALRCIVDSRFPMNEAAAAHRRVETRRARGKVLLIPPSATESA